MISITTIEKLSILKTLNKPLLRKRKSLQAGGHLQMEDMIISSSIQKDLTS
jgi:hypothetical protein